MNSMPLTPALSPRCGEREYVLPTRRGSMAFSPGCGEREYVLPTRRGSMDLFPRCGEREYVLPVRRGSKPRLRRRADGRGVPGLPLIPDL